MEFGWSTTWCFVEHLKLKESLLWDHSESAAVVLQFLRSDTTLITTSGIIQNSCVPLLLARVCFFLTVWVRVRRTSVLIQCTYQLVSLGPSWSWPLSGETFSKARELMVRVGHGLQALLPGQWIRRTSTKEHFKDLCDHWRPVYAVDIYILHILGRSIILPGTTGWSLVKAFL